MTKISIEDGETFEFETKILNGGTFSIGIGLTTNIGMFGEGRSPEEIDENTIGLVLNDKAFCHGQNYTEVFSENNANGDVIRCHLEQHHICGVVCHGYWRFEVFRNGVSLRRQLVREQKMYPCIWVSSGHVVLQTKFKGMCFVCDNIIQILK